MGEYANYLSKRVKIGTCEDMLYLRWDQRHLVTDSETPLFDEKVLGAIRFRFPWPEEDDVTPGGFEDAFKSWRLNNFEQPQDVEHGLVQFRHEANGYLVSLPCPEANELTVNGKTITIHKNGYGGPASLVQQAWRRPAACYRNHPETNCGHRQLVGIARCNGCHALYRLEDGYEKAAAVAIRAEADRKVRDYEHSKQMVAAGLWQQTTDGDLATARRIHEVADRLLAGYRMPVPA